MKQEEIFKKKLIPYMILAGLALIWGSSFILMKKGMETFTSGQVAAMRIFIAFLCLFPFVISSVRKIEKKDWKYLVLSGFLGNGIPAFLFTTAETGISSSLAGILNSLTPLFTVIAGYFWFRTKVRMINVAGIIIGFAGTLWLLLYASGGKLNIDLYYSSLVILATICYAFSVNIIKTHLHHIESKLISGFALFVVGPLCGIYLFSTDIINRSIHHPQALNGYIYVLILGVFGTAISLLYFNKLIKMSSAMFASSTTYFIPIVAVLWGIADHEKSGIVYVASMAVILSGMYLINKKPD